MPPIFKFCGLLLMSNLFMTYAWYGHLRTLKDYPWYVAAVLSWGVALLEYMFQVPGNRIGKFDAHLTLAQMKITQEVITLLVFVPFTIYFMGERLRTDFIWAGLCLVGAVYFVFRGSGMAL